MSIQLDEHGLVPAIAQDINTKEVLMLGYVNPSTISRTLQSGEVWFYSRSREDLWHKGEVSGNHMRLKKAYIDCDSDTVLFQVEPEGPVCHTGEQTCFFAPLPDDAEYEAKGWGASLLDELFAVIQDRKRTLPEGSYTTSLFQAGLSKVAQKVIEEAGESALAAVQHEKPQLAEEIADLFYHVLVMLAATDTSPSEVWQVLRERRK